MYYFFLGSSPKLSVLELETVLKSDFSSVSQVIYQSDLPPSQLAKLDLLGGTAKVAKEMGPVSAANLIQALQSAILESSAKNFAFTNYSSLPLTQQDLYNLKKSIARHKPVRFISFTTKPHELIGLKKKHVDELNILPAKDAATLARTVWIYDSLGFAARDRRRPYQDIKRGMLPLKLARLMVNLGTYGEPDQTVYDPFCGTGTILAEALMTGCRVIGSDLDRLAVEGTSANLAWITQKFGLANDRFEIKLGDAVKPVFPRADCVVTEPYMGPLLDARHVPSREKLLRITKGLDKLYRGTLRALHPLLPKGGRVIITFPTFRASPHDLATISVDTITSLGYNFIASVPYSKPGATVIRHITILEKLANQ